MKSLLALLKFGLAKRFVANEWHELIHVNTNSIPCHEQYLRFLIELETDFHRGVVIWQKIELLNQNRVRETDYTFKTFVQMFPRYLIHHIMDCERRLCFQDEHEASTGTSSTKTLQDTEYTIKGEICW
jgi:hypothetical protein